VQPPSGDHRIGEVECGNRGQFGRDELVGDLARAWAYTGQRGVEGPATQKSSQPSGRDLAAIRAE
jgi:hypothetical protein